ncbi:hypothetical protein L1889_17530 [Paenalcaligenes niemegkensis]|uniref:hypothetical protein n=1 Tax=Paenalcaligenes niemegkensis TaxID=2895469 RepID=UPI001EE8A0B9|nr:hypothetical protein [Paenalcaligenes niemegkensis]MCQ9618257.1 hypothetical protein [Paenalcaligenes niemegkensis]
MFQASSKFEAEDIRRVLENAVIKVAEDIGSMDFVDAMEPKDEKTLRLVFVSRISPMKNLLGAIKILAMVQSPIIYDIYGPIEDQHYWARCQESIKTLPSYIQVAYKGVLSPLDVIETIADYDVFLCLRRAKITGMLLPKRCVPDCLY